MQKSNAPLDVTPVSKSIGYLLRRASRRFREVTVPLLKEYGLSPLELTTLNLIDQNPDCVLRTLARAVAVEPPAMNRIANSLEDKGLIARRKSKTDARYTYFSISPEGLRRIQDASDAILNLEAEVLKALTAEEKDALFLALQKLTD